MERKIALTVLTFVLALNIGPLFTSRIDRGIATIDSSLYDKIEDRTCVDLSNDMELRAGPRTRSVYAHRSRR